MKTALACRWGLVALAVGALCALPLAKREIAALRDLVRMNVRRNASATKRAAKWVTMAMQPPMCYGFDVMRTGVLQHLDRDYTYDVVPAELLGGFLFQGVHRPPKGTAIRFQLHAPAVVYFFFHEQVDGGYSAIFPGLEGWTRSAAYPQYDIHNGDHGLKMTMYRLSAPPGTYSIPATTEDRACFNMVFVVDRGDSK